MEEEEVKLSRVKGMLAFQCPACGHIQKRRLDYGSWRVECAFAGCRRIFQLRHVLSPSKTGPKARDLPPDLAPLMSAPL